MSKRLLKNENKHHALCAALEVFYLKLGLTSGGQSLIMRKKKKQN